MLPLVPVGAVIVTGAAAYAATRRKKKEMSQQQEKIYAAALNTLKDPVKLRQLADTFEKEGFKAQADLLRKRAKLRELPEDIKAKRREIWRKAITSTNIPGILTVAAAYEKEGCTGAAAKLREYANSLEKAT